MEALLGAVSVHSTHINKSATLLKCGVATEFDSQSFFFFFFFFSFKLWLFCQVRLCAHLSGTALFGRVCAQIGGKSLSFIIVIKDIMTSVGDKRCSTAWWKPDTVTAAVERAVKVATVVKKSGLGCVPHQYSPG